MGFLSKLFGGEQGTTKTFEETRQETEREPGQGYFAHGSRKCELSIQRHVRLSAEELSKSGLNQDGASAYNDVEDLGQRLIAHVLEFWIGKVPSTFTWTEDSIVSPRLRLADGGYLFGEEAVREMVTEYINADLGDISDLPPEIAQAIHLSLYKYFSLLKEPSGIPATVIKERVLVEFTAERSDLGALIEALIPSVKALRKIEPGSWLYQYSVDFILERGGYRPKNVVVRNSVAEVIDAVIQSRGFKLLDQPMSYLVLNKEFLVNWTNQKVARGGDFLAAVRITELSQFDMLRDYFLPDADSAFLKWKATQKENVNREIFGHMMQVAIDVLAIAVVREFQAQSPEFRQLSST